MEKINSLIKKTNNNIGAVQHFTKSYASFSPTLSKGERLQSILTTSNSHSLKVDYSHLRF